MKRIILWLIAGALLLAVTVSYTAPVLVTNKATAEYIDAAGTSVRVDSNEVSVYRVNPPVLAGVPSRVIPGQTSELTVTADIGGAAWSYIVYLPLNGATLVANSIVVTGTTFTQLETTASYVAVKLNALANPAAGENLVTVKYKVTWK